MHQLLTAPYFQLFSAALCSAPGGWSGTQHGQAEPKTIPIYFIQAIYVSATSTLTCYYSTVGGIKPEQIYLNSTAYTPASNGENGNWGPTSNGQACQSANNVITCPLNSNNSKH